VDVRDRGRDKARGNEGQEWSGQGGGVTWEGEELGTRREKQWGGKGDLTLTVLKVGACAYIRQQLAKVKGII